LRRILRRLRSARTSPRLVRLRQLSSRFARPVVSDGFVLVGAAAAVYGISLISVAAAFVIGGAGSIAFGVSLADGPAPAESANDVR
jgi:hypothetical protein